MRRRIHPKKIILGMMARACGECTNVQHVFFKTQTEYDEWGCPVCSGRIEPDEDKTGTQGTDTAGGEEDEDPIPVSAEDS